MKWFGIIGLCLWMGLLEAQTVTISEELPFRKDEYYELIGKLKDHFLVYRNLRDDYEVVAFDERMRIDWQKDVVLTGKRQSVLDIVDRDDFFDILYLTRVDGISQLRLDRYNPAANMIDTAVVVDYGKQYYMPKAELLLSEDEEIALTYHFEKQKEMQVVVFDLIQKEQLWQKTFYLDNVDIEEELLQVLTDNHGNLYIILDRENRKSRMEDHRFEIVHFDAQTQSASQVSVPMPEKLTYDVSFTFDDLNGNLVAGGLYSNQNRGVADGYFLLMVAFDGSGENVLQFTSFPKEFLEKLLGNRTGKKDELSDVVVSEVILRRDGGILLIGELSRQFERYTASSSRRVYGTSYITDYFFDDIFVVSIHPDGKEHWKTIFYKKQYSQDDDALYSSYFLAKTPISLRFLFNDEIKSGTTVSEYVLDGTGHSNRNSVLSTKNQKIKLRFKDAMQVEADEVIVPSDHRGKLKLVQIKYN